MNKIDKIVATFTKTVTKLRAEADSLVASADVANTRAHVLTAHALDCDAEAERASKIADNLEGIINV